MKIHKTKILFATGILGVLTATAQSQVYMCKPCSAGQYAEKGSTSCKTCEAGYYSQVGASSCTKCGTNEYSKAGASSCTKCGADEVSDGTKCIKCGELQYVKNGKCTDVQGKIVATLAELTEGGKESTGVLSPGFYAVILGGGDGGNAFHNTAPILTTKSKRYVVGDDDPRTANIGGRGAQVQYIFKITGDNVQYRLASGANGQDKKEHDGQQAGGGGASWIMWGWSSSGYSTNIDGQIWTDEMYTGRYGIITAGGGGGRSGITTFSCFDGGAQGGFGGGLGAGGGGGDDYGDGSGMNGGASGNLKGGNGFNSKGDGGNGEGLLFEDCPSSNGASGGGCCTTGGRGGATDSRSKFYTYHDDSTWGKYGGMGGFCTEEPLKYEPIYQSCFFQGGGCASCGADCDPSEEIAKFKEKFGDGDAIRRKFNRFDAIGSVCTYPIQNFEKYNLGNLSIYYIRHPGNGKSNVQSNTDKFTSKLCKHCAKLYRIE